MFNNVKRCMERMIVEKGRIVTWRNPMIKTHPRGKNEGAGRKGVMILFTAIIAELRGIASTSVEDDLGIAIQ